MLDRFQYLNKYMAHSTTIIFFCGFFFDMLILPDIEDSFGRHIGLLYIIIIAVFIIFREWLISKNKASILERRLYSISTFGIAYFSGSSLSFVFIFALRAADFSVSWPLFLVLAICIYANEFVNTHGFRLTTDVGVLFFAFLFYTVFHLPVILKLQSDKVFALSILIVLVISFLYAKILKRFSESARHEYPKFSALAIGIPMFVGMLYFLNVLPAVPLSLKDRGVYHYVNRLEKGEFLFQGEEDNRFLKSMRTPIYHLTPKDNGVYFFSSVSAPAELYAPVSHVWEYFDEKENKWTVNNIVNFTISGGREDGYRAYSKKENVQEGAWRVTVKVGNNRVVGRMKFFVVKSDTVKLKEYKF